MKTAVLDIAASKTGALSILKDFYGYLKERGTSDNEWIFITGVTGILEDVPEKKIRVICREDVKASSKNRLRFDLFTGKAFLEGRTSNLTLYTNCLPKGRQESITHIILLLYKKVKQNKCPQLFMKNNGDKR